LMDPTITAIEADILMGHVKGREASSVGRIPIMAHPPDRVSDLFLDDFLEACMEDGLRHLKLDFKELLALQVSLPILASHAKRFWENGQSIFINADILPGPGRKGAPATIPADEFFAAVLGHCPGIPLSLGWTCCTAAFGEGYTKADCEEMLRVYKEYVHKLPVASGGVVFAVSLRLAQKSFPELVNLLRHAPTSQLLLWTGNGELAVSPTTVTRLRSWAKNEGVSERVGFDCRTSETVLEAWCNDLLICLGGIWHWLGMM